MSAPHFQYQIRESARAKYMSLRVTVDRGLEVVVPRGFNRTLIPCFLREKQDWVQAALSKVEQARERRPADPAQQRPNEVRLPSVGKTWSIEYTQKASHRIQLIDHQDGQLQLIGPVENLPACHTALQMWTHRQAHTILVPWLRRLSGLTGIAFVQTAIRCQKSRWGSCSTSGTISLNQKLIYVDTDLVD